MISSRVREKWDDGKGIAMMKHLRGTAADSRFTRVQGELKGGARCEGDCRRRRSIRLGSYGGTCSGVAARALDSWTIESPSPKWLDRRRHCRGWCGPTGSPVYRTVSARFPFPGKAASCAPHVRRFASCWRCKGGQHRADVGASSAGNSRILSDSGLLRVF